MIGAGKFRASVNDVERLLTKMGFAPERVYGPNYTGIASKVRVMSYVEQWEFCYREHAYDFKLFDSSLLQFQREPLSYAYVECPYDIPSFDAFLRSRDTDAGGAEDTVVARAEYENLISSVDPKIATPMRFDYDPGAYREGVHPAAQVKS